MACVFYRSVMNWDIQCCDDVTLFADCVRCVFEVPQKSGSLGNINNLYHKIVPDCVMAQHKSQLLSEMLLLFACPVFVYYTYLTVFHNTNQERKSIASISIEAIIGIHPRAGLCARQPFFPETDWSPLSAICP